MLRTPRLDPVLARRVFRFVAFAEAASWAGLLVGMLLKYVLVDDERLVHVFGPIHGALFIAYVLVVLAVQRVFRWSLPVTLVALGCSVPPFATVLFEVWAERTGRVTPSAAPASSPDPAPAASAAAASAAPTAPAPSSAPDEVRL